MKRLKAIGILVLLCASIQAKDIRVGFSLFIDDDLSESVTSPTATVGSLVIDEQTVVVYPDPEEAAEVAEILKEALRHG